jgi:two-component system heavy metal sensor histidine kinase CusS
MLARLEESFTRLSQFSADLAHELRTPVNNLICAADVALSRSRTPEEYKEVLESGLEEYGRLSRMIDSLLFLARAENPETKVQKVPFDARKEIQSVIDFYEPLSQEEGVDLATAAPESNTGPVTLKADVDLFRRALSNLISNALHHTPRGGRVTVSARVAGGGVEVEVADSGCGIGPEHLPRIFDRFYRADRARAHHPEGAGLGLPIVKSILDLHGGTVSVRSQLGKGATFTLRFPAAHFPRPPIG